MKTIQPETLQHNLFDLIGKRWMLITAEKDGIANTMTASWGSMGILWNLPCAFIYVRPQRHTRTFIDSAEHVSLSFFDESWRKQLSYLGTVSGRDEPKIEKAGLHIISDESAPRFAEASMTMICRKLYRQDMDEACFIDRSLIDSHYPLHDLHTMYVLHIGKIMVSD